MLAASRVLEPRPTNTFEDSLPDIASRPARHSLQEPWRLGEVGSFRQPGRSREDKYETGGAPVQGLCGHLPPTSAPVSKDSTCTKLTSQLSWLRETRR